jgi:hypothetical protein
MEDESGMKGEEESEMKGEEELEMSERRGRIRNE